MTFYYCPINRFLNVISSVCLDPPLRTPRRYYHRNTLTMKKLSIICLSVVPEDKTMIQQNNDQCSDSWSQGNGANSSNVTLHWRLNCQITFLRCKGTNLKARLRHLVGSNEMRELIGFQKPFQRLHAENVRSATTRVYRKALIGQKFHSQFVVYCFWPKNKRYFRKKCCWIILKLVATLEQLLQKW